MTIEQFTDDFINRYTGKRVCFPAGKFCGQCLSLAKQFIKEYYKISPPPSGCGGARCYWSKFPNPLGTVLKKVKNTPDLIPQKGWIVVWNSNLGQGFGHIAIIVDANLNAFHSFDSNWGSKTARIVRHNYDNVEGFLAPKGSMSNDTMTIEKKTFNELVEKSTKYDELVQAGCRDVKACENIQNRVIDLEKEVDTLRKENKKLSKKIDSLSDMVSQRDNQIAVLEDERGKLENKYKDCNQAANALTDMVKDLGDKLDKCKEGSPSSKEAPETLTIGNSTLEVNGAKWYNGEITVNYDLKES